MSNTKEFPLVAVHIEANKNSTHTVEVPEHQVRVLRAIWDGPGVEKVKVQGPAGDPNDPDTIDLDVDPRVEYDRLYRTYDRPNAANPVALVFPNGPADLEKYGFSIDEAAAGQPIAQTEGSQVIKHKKVKPKAAASKA